MEPAGGYGQTNKADVDTPIDNPPSYQEAMNWEDEPADTVLLKTSMFDGCTKKEVDADLMKPAVIKQLIRIAIGTTATIADPTHGSQVQRKAATKMGKAIGAVAIAVGELTNESPVTSAMALAEKLRLAVKATADAQTSKTPFTTRVVAKATILADYINFQFTMTDNLRGFSVKALQHAHDAATGLVWALPKGALRTLLPVFGTTIFRVGQAIALTPPTSRREVAAMFSNYATDIDNTLLYLA